jgi:integration host factor subunit beta
MLAPPALALCSKPNSTISSKRQRVAASHFAVPRAFSLIMAADHLTKSELIAKLAERYPQLVAKDADFAVKTILDEMSRTLALGRRIEIRGFDSFSLNIRPARQGRNPKSGAKVIVPEKRVPHFKPGKELRELVDVSHQKVNGS